MIKLMIVDDEAIIRQGIRQTVNWEEHDITIAGDARSGNTAFKKALVLRPDIVIIDIRMPDGNGIWLANKLLEVLPHVRMIMLSGYNDMEYMMEAIKLGVREYLLKPAGSAQILKSVLKLRDEILLEQKQKEQTNTMENLFSENIDTLKQRFIEDLLEGRLSEQVAMERAEALQLPLQGPQYMVFLAHQNQEQDWWELMQILSTELEPYKPLLTTHEKWIIAILNTNRPAEESYLHQLVERLEGQIDSMHHPCISSPCALSQLPAPYQACLACSNRSIWFPGSFSIATDIAKYPQLPASEILDAERRIIQAVRFSNLTQFTEEIQALFALLNEYKPDIEMFQTILLEIARSIRIFSENDDVVHRLEMLFQSPPYSVEDARKLLLTLIHGDFAEYGPQVKKALDFIAMHHMKDDLSLSDVANALYISPSYLTRLLKDKTGSGFNKWLHTIRISNAKSLLESTDLRLYEIAEKVGYKSYKAFSEYFNKLVGSSARSYRFAIRQHADKQDNRTSAQESG